LGRNVDPQCERGNERRIVKFFLYGTYIPADQLAPVAMAAEELGFDAISLPDHVVYPFEVQTPYPYAKDPATGRAPWDESGEWPDPVVASAVVTAVTTRLRAITGVFVLPMRDPLLVAKAFSTLSAVSPGRVILGIGAGWMREEFEILGFDFATRGPRTDEAIEVMRRLWTGGRVGHDGRFFAFPDVAMQPAPAGGAVPIYIGGDSPPALRRAARLGDGCLPPLHSQPRTAEHLATIARIREEHGRTGPFEYVASAVAMGSPQELMTLAALGVESVHVDPFGLYVRKFGGLTLDERRGALKRYAREVIVPVNGR
jgi:probable F420-dependent oxidoreductase